MKRLEEKAYQGIVREVTDNKALITIFRDKKSYVREYFLLNQEGLFTPKQPNPGDEVVYHVQKKSNGDIKAYFEVIGPAKKNLSEKELEKAKEIFEGMMEKYGIQDKKGNLEKEFNRLYSQYYKETAHMSFPVFENPSYQQIIKMGKEVIPFIFKQIKKRHDIDLICAIEEISGERPSLPRKYAGNVDKMTEYILKWGKQKGYTK